MKTFCTFIYLFLGIQCTFSQVSASDLFNYIDKKVEYCDKVHGSFMSNGKSKVILLNMGAEYPNQKLTVAIFEKNWKKFDYKPAELLKEKMICVTGKIVIYKEKPEIIVNGPEQIKIQ